MSPTVPVQHDVIQCPPLYVQHVRVHGARSGLLQQPHVVGYDPLEKGARVRALDLQQAPVREVVTHKRTRDRCRVPAVLTPSDSGPCRSGSTGDRRDAQIPTGAFSGINTESYAGCERSAGDAPTRHVVHCLLAAVGVTVEQSVRLTGTSRRLHNTGHGG